MPRIRPAMPSGRNGSSDPNCSPVPMNLMGTPGDMLHRQDSTAPGVAVQLRQDDTVEFQGGVEGTRAVDRVLPRHAVDDEIHLIGLDLSIDLLELRHQLVVNRQPSGRVQDTDPSALVAGLLDPLATDADRILRLFVRIDGDTQLLTDDVQLVNGSRALQVGRHEERSHSLLLQERLANLPQVVVLPEPCRPHSMITVISPRSGMAGSTGPIDPHHFLVHDTDQLLAGVQRIEHPLARGPARVT